VAARIPIPRGGYRSFFSRNSPVRFCHVSRQLDGRSQAQTDCIEKSILPLGIFRPADRIVRGAEPESSPRHCAVFRPAISENRKLWIDLV
jgi:hypothetical protein